MYIFYASASLDPRMIVALFGAAGRCTCPATHGFVCNETMYPLAIDSWLS